MLSCQRAILGTQLFCNLPRKERKEKKRSENKPLPLSQCRAWPLEPQTTKSGSQCEQNQPEPHQQYKGLLLSLCYYKQEASNQGPILWSHPLPVTHKKDVKRIMNNVNMGGTAQLEIDNVPELFQMQKQQHCQKFHIQWDLGHLWHTFLHPNQKHLCTGLDSRHDGFQSGGHSHKKKKNSSNIFLISTSNLDYVAP